jgi:tetratricopeptide (TPR) repeat protein
VLFNHLNIEKEIIIMLNHQLLFTDFVALPEVKLEQVENYIKENGDVNKANIGEAGCTPLTWLLSNYHMATDEQKLTYLKAMQLLCTAGAGWLLPDKNSMTPSVLAKEVDLSPQEIAFVLSEQRQHFFSSLGQATNEAQVIETVLANIIRFLSNGLDPNAYNEGNQGKTPLTFLLTLYQNASEPQKARLIAVMKCLTKYGANWSLPDRTGQTPIAFMQIHRLLPEILPKFVEVFDEENQANNEAKVSQEEIDKQTEKLFSVLPNYDLAQIQSILRAGADPNAPKGKKKRTPLTSLLLRWLKTTADERQLILEVIGLLLTHGANWELEDGANRSPKALAKQCGVSLADIPQPNFVQQALPSINVDLPYLLFLGAGNMSLELAFANKHPTIAPFMVVSTFESEENAPSEAVAISNKQALLSKGAIILHGVDATQLHKYLFTRMVYFQDIYFSHPHTGDIRTNAPMIDAFFDSAGQFQKMGNKIHIFRLRGGEKTTFPDIDTKPGKSRNQRYQKLYGFIPGKMLSGGYVLNDKNKFNNTRYPGYQHRKTGASPAGAANVDKDNSIEYVFVKVSENNLAYRSDYLSSEECSDTNPAAYAGAHSAYFLLPYLTAAAHRAFETLDTLFEEDVTHEAIIEKIQPEILQYLSQSHYCDVGLGLGLLARYFESKSLCELAAIVFEKALAHTDTPASVTFLIEHSRFLCQQKNYTHAITILDKIIQQAHASQKLAFSANDTFCVDESLQQAISMCQELTLPITLYAYYLRVVCAAYLSQNDSSDETNRILEQMSVFVQENNLTTDMSAILLAYAYQQIGDLNSAQRCFTSILNEPKFALAQAGLQAVTSAKSKQGAQTGASTLTQAPHAAFHRPPPRHTAASPATPATAATLSALRASG